MFGFQPVPMGVSYTTPAPPTPPINLVDPCSIPLGWTEPTLPAWSASPSNRTFNLLPYVSGASNFFTKVTISGSHPAALEVLSYPDYTTPSLYINDVCSSPFSNEVITLNIQWPECTGYDTTQITVDYCCNSADWITDPITIYGTANSTIQFNLANYVDPATLLGCPVTYFFTDEGSQQSFSISGSVVDILYTSAGTYYGASATAANSCQCVSAIQVGIIFEIT